VRPVQLPKTPLPMDFTEEGMVMVVRPFMQRDPASLPHICGCCHIYVAVATYTVGLSETCHLIFTVGLGFPIAPPLPCTRRSGA